jgi:eukaryotic-like serine/threonine-protein kinase
MTQGVFDNARTVLRGSDLPGLDKIIWLNHGQYIVKGVEDPVIICEAGEETRISKKAPTSSEKAHRTTSPDQEPVLGWRPSVKDTIPNTPWVLEEKLGEGGFGEVWLAQNKTLKETRVFKFCFRADKVRSLKREVTLFRVLKEHAGEHPGVVRIFDVFFEEPPFYIAMERGGKNLVKWCEENGGVQNIALETKLEIVSKVAEALAGAHAAGIIHRDIKPSNILIAGTTAKDIKAKLTDFGIGQVISK